MLCVGFLHTAEVHVATFDALLAGERPSARTTHVVDGTLLALAVQHGLTPQVHEGVRRRVAELGDAGADAIVCTCSTLGPAAEAAGRASTVPVVRVDRAMAEQAIRIGRRIAVVAALDSTVEATVELLEQCSTTPLDISIERCEDAWAAFARDDLDAYASQVALAARRAARDVDVVVLAQASMAPAAERLADLDVPVLASPSLAVQAALDAYASSRRTGHGARSGPLV